MYVATVASDGNNVSHSMVDKSWEEGHGRA